MAQGPHSVSLGLTLGVPVSGFLGILERLPGKPYLIKSSDSIKIGVETATHIHMLRSPCPNCAKLMPKKKPANFNSSL
jgi:hypothetical protein